MGVRVCVVCTLTLIGRRRLLQAHCLLCGMPVLCLCCVGAAGVVSVTRPEERALLVTGVFHLDYQHFEKRGGKDDN